MVAPTGNSVSVLFATSELAPWVKTGGLGDVAAALPRALAGLGMDVAVLVPGYPAMLKAFPKRRRVAVIESFAELPAATVSIAHPGPRLALFILECAACYDRPGGPYTAPDGDDWADNAIRYGLLSRVAALLSSSASPLAWRPHVLHCNDWQTALAPAYLRFVLQAEAASVMTIHNLAFQGIFEPESLASLGLPAHAFSIDGVEFHGRVSFLKAGLQCADRITTVSPTYREEILGPELGCGLDGLLRFRAADLEGILNGIDTTVWNPQRDRLLPACYSREHPEGKGACRRALERESGLATAPEAPLLGMVGRMTWQKGADLVLALVDDLVADGARLVVLGSGEAAIEDAWRSAARRHPGNVAVTIGFDERLAHLIEAGSDIFVMPSRFEPCGLNQMYSLAYGTPPVVRATGGLADTVIDWTGRAADDAKANGFSFVADSPFALLEAIQRAIALWRDKPAWSKLVRTGMSEDFSWARAAQRYAALYRALR